MSRKPRKKKKKRHATPPARGASPSKLRSTARSLQKRGGVAMISGGFVLIAGLLLVVALVWTEPDETDPPKTGEAAAEPNRSVPAPDTRHMEPPVRSRLETARRTVEERPDSGPAWGGYGALCDAHGLYDCAVACYTVATELDPTDFRWFYLLAFVSELRGGSPDRIVAYYTEASRLEPRLPTIFYRLGEALTRAGRLAEAANAYRKALEIDPQLAVAHRGLGQVVLAQGDAQAAVGSLTKAIELGAEGNPATLASLAQAEMRRGNTAAAEAYAQRAASAAEELPVPDPVRLRIQQMNVSAAQSAARAVRLIQAGRYEAALEQLRIVEQTRPDEPSTHYRIGVCLAHLGKPDEALTRLERAAELAPDNEVVRKELERVRGLLES
ncbi:MAG: tetratricopeptide repeat protein [Acidobacteria bacterium]|nr:tetratricopeptide repeat protein [Acidobacteriota bacterium]NIM60757.1 tetratricopeptide repeat protein [Acidobacteriota bacterium]NIO57970.1 tetratricopeptide repeat protein [Acidobacteriota bacterium]NIQ28975.1 tetratricopeptide repeat protein [Acidobacteriota bacterium]NIQ83447.1 tetratricopeptide repeat protein [Acidobacteriota bacterium]